MHEIIIFFFIIKLVSCHFPHLCIKLMSAMLIEGHLNALIYWIAPRCSHYKRTPGIIYSSLKSRGTRPFTNLSYSSLRVVVEGFLRTHSSFSVSRYQHHTSIHAFLNAALDKAHSYILAGSRGGKNLVKKVFRYLFINIVACLSLLSHVRSERITDDP